MSYEQLTQAVADLAASTTELKQKATAAIVAAGAKLKVNAAYPFTYVAGQTQYDVGVISGDATITTAGMALWIEGVIEYAFTVDTMHKFTLVSPETYADGQQMRVIVNARYDHMWEQLDTLFGAEKEKRTQDYLSYLDSLGLEAEVPYAAGIELVRTTQVVRYLDVNYRPVRAALPFTTSTWATDQSKLLQAEDVSLRQTLMSPQGAESLGYLPSYPGEGLESGDVADVLSERVSVKRFGVSSGNTGIVNTDKFQKALESAADNGFVIELPWELFNVPFAGQVYVDHTMITDQRGVSIAGCATRRNRLLYTGPGHFLNITGLGTEDNTPITQFELSNFRITAQNNPTSIGGIYLDRVNRVKLYGISCDSFANAASRLIEIRNYFNVDLEKFNISGGGSLPQGQYGLVYGSKNSGAGDEWNSSNLKIHNGLIQRMAGKGAVLIHDGNICDNVQFEHVSFGSNALGSLSCVSGNMRNLAVQNCHFESAGKQPDGSFVAATHINVALITGLEIKNNDMKDAQIHVAIDQVKGFDLGLNNVSEAGVYVIDNSIGFQVTGTAGNRSSGRIANNNVYTTQIDQPYVADVYSAVDPGTHEVTEAAWSSVYASKPGYYGKNLLLRKELNMDNPDGQFDQVWLSPQAQWLRVVLSTRHVGWGSTFPTTGSYTLGDLVLNESPALINNGTPYTTLGWRRLTTGSNHVAGTDWVGIRCLTGAVAFTSSYNGAEPLKLGGYYIWVDATGRLRIKSGAPTSDTDGTVVGSQT